MSRDLPILAVTPGDPEGIGPEIVWKAIRKDIARKLGVRILCVGARKPFERLKAPIDAMDACDFSDPRKGTSNSRVWLYAAPDQPEKRGAHLGGYQSGWAIREATHMVKEGIAAAIVTGEKGDRLKQRLRTGTVVTNDDRNWELRFTQERKRINLSRAIAVDMESGTIAAQGYRLRVPYGTLLCVSDKPLHGEIKLPGAANAFYERAVAQHLQIGLKTLELLGERRESLHSRKLRSFDEPPFR